MLINQKKINDEILCNSKWADSHGADADSGFLGAGMLYYSLAYMLRAKLCVCIGSGGGFVPRLMRQAQRDLGLADARTILIDANTGEWKRPDWLDEDSFFRRHYGDIEIIIERSSDVFLRSQTRQWKIDYLHVDGDHSHGGSLEDVHNYGSLMSPHGIITFHDTKPYNYYNITCWKTIQDMRRKGCSVIDFPWIGGGTAIMQTKNMHIQPKISDSLHRQYIFNFLSTLRERVKKAFTALKPIKK